MKKTVKLMTVACLLVGSMLMSSCSLFETNSAKKPDTSNTDKIITDSPDKDVSVPDDTEKPSSGLTGTIIGGSSDTGDTGNSGNTGDTGNTDNSGNTGDTGDSEDTGDSGDSGNTGDTGDEPQVLTLSDLSDVLLTSTSIYVDGRFVTGYRFKGLKENTKYRVNWKLSKFPEFGSVLSISDNSCIRVYFDDNFGGSYLESDFIRIELMDDSESTFISGNNGNGIEITMPSFSDYCFFGFVHYVGGDYTVGQARDAFASCVTELTFTEIME